MKISMIAAIGRNRVIGKDNDLMWSLPDDMKFFKSKTAGKPVLMGRKNWESLPPKFQPLPNRLNLVMSRNNNYQLPEGVVLVNSVEQSINIAKSAGHDELCIIGGEEIYKMGLAVADTMFLTEVDFSEDGDAYFPEFDKSQWNEIERISHSTDEKHKYAFDFVTYRRI